MLEPIHSFNSTILVLWAIMFVPYAIHHRKFLAFMVTAVLLFGVNFYLSDKFDILENVLSSGAVIVTASIGGVLFYHFEYKKNRGPPPDS